MLTGLLFYQMQFNRSNPEFVCRIPVPICGTKNPELTENQKKEKKFSTPIVLACHKLDFINTGPPLRGVDSLVFTKWILQKKHKIDSTKIENLGIDYHRTMFKDYINDENLPLVIDYCSTKRDY
ncbi:hypothetical protein ACQ9BO_01705 [Flavobacterium sp. P21]|uniref:hypothetical protein n=1 Tax=Flavobacterium sp. P21 TaxID=3423948 RepID=UPI003D669DB2